MSYNQYKSISNEQNVRDCEYLVTWYIQPHGIFYDTPYIGISVQGILSIWACFLTKDVL